MFTNSKFVFKAFASIKRIMDFLELEEFQDDSVEKDKSLSGE